jgi:sugar/nucleoside kinase (ribokinase family)
MRKLDQTDLHADLPTGRSFQVIGFGENAVDLVCRVPHFPENDSKVRMEKLLQLGGGQVATATSFCARYGLRTRYIGCVGDDDLGEFARRDLSKESMDVLLDTVRGSTSHLSIIIVDKTQV